MRSKRERTSPVRLRSKASGLIRSRVREVSAIAWSAPSGHAARGAPRQDEVVERRRGLGASESLSLPAFAFDAVVRGLEARVALPEEPEPFFELEEPEELRLEEVVLRRFGG